MLYVNLCLIAQAQILYTPSPIPYPSSRVTEKDKHGFFVAQKVKGKLSGTGLYKYKNGTVYIGDFKDKKPNGFGMLICSEEDTITNCPNSKIYVGKFKDGVKRGKGVCYNSNGEMIYRGRFENDIPLSEYTIIKNEPRYFSDAKTDDFYFIGEFEGTSPNGFGSIFFSNGDILISKFEDGQRVGISIYLEHDGNWMSENVEDGKSTFISSSREYASYVEGSKSEWNASLRKALGSLSDWSVALNELSLQLGSSQSSDYSSEGVFQNYDSSENSTGEKGTYANYEKYNLSEQRAYNRDKSTYSKYDSMLSQAFAGNRKASPNEIKSWQNKMKQLRKKWEAKGKDFPHFPNEDK